MCLLQHPHQTQMRLLFKMELSKLNPGPVESESLGKKASCILTGSPEISLVMLKFEPHKHSGVVWY